MLSAKKGVDNLRKIGYNLSKIKTNLIKTVIKIFSIIGGGG